MDSIPTHKFDVTFNDDIARPSFHSNIRCSSGLFIPIQDTSGGNTRGSNHSLNRSLYGLVPLLLSCSLSLDQSLYRKFF
jgi:hypothetical protein